MKNSLLRLAENNFMKISKKLELSCLFFVMIFFVTVQLIAQNPPLSANTLLSGKKKVIVYSDIPEHEKDTKFKLKSNYYKIEVRTKRTDPWTTVFAHKTYNKNGVDPAVEGFDPLTDDIFDTGGNPPSSFQNYVGFTAAWTHTYGNFEMELGAKVEVRITKLNGATGSAVVAPVAITKSAAHPEQNITSEGIKEDLANGSVTFFMDKPGQVVIDFDGAMDDNMKHFQNNNSDVYDANQKLIFPVVHAVSIFANPIIIGKPLPDDSNVIKVKAGDTPVPFGNDKSKTIMYFMPGVHNLGLNFKLLQGKKYYIPGDAIVYGTLNNFGSPSGKDIPNGKNIRVFGCGTISGAKLRNPGYVDPKKEPGNITVVDVEQYKSLGIENAINDEKDPTTGKVLATVEGITIVDPANHSINIEVDKKTYNAQKPRVPMTFANWVKIISWRGNGDGIGQCHEVSDGFFRTNDDTAYIKGNKYRDIFWKDHNAAILNMTSIDLDDDNSFPLEIKQCEVIYARSRNGKNGRANTGVFHQRAAAGRYQQTGTNLISLLVEDFLVSDTRTNMPLYNMYVEGGSQTGPAYHGITFRNVSTVPSVLDALDIPKQIIEGGVQKILDENKVVTETKITYFSVTFDNCSLVGKPLGLSDFITNQKNGDDGELGDELIFKNVPKLGITDVNSADNGVRVYLNSNIIHVNFPNADTSREIQVFNLLGQKLYSAITLNDTIAIDVKLLNLKGVAIVKVISGTEVSSHKVLVY